MTAGCNVSGCCCCKPIKLHDGIDAFVKSRAHLPSAQGCENHIRYFKAARRTFITNLAAKGVGVRVLASLAGHQSIATTQHYIDVNDDMKRAAVQLI